MVEKKMRNNSKQREITHIMIRALMSFFFNYLPCPIAMSKLEEIIDQKLTEDLEQCKYLQ